MTDKRLTYLRKVETSFSSFHGEVVTLLHECPEDVQRRLAGQVFNNLYSIRRVLEDAASYVRMDRVISGPYSVEGKTVAGPTMGGRRFITLRTRGDESPMVVEEGGGRNSGVAGQGSSAGHGHGVDQQAPLTLNPEWIQTSGPSTVSSTNHGSNQGGSNAPMVFTTDQGRVGVLYYDAIKRAYVPTGLPVVNAPNVGGGGNSAPEFVNDEIDVNVSGHVSNNDTDNNDLLTVAALSGIYGK
jgi:hypothetical protein